MLMFLFSSFTFFEFFCIVDESTHGETKCLKSENGTSEQRHLEKVIMQD